MINTPWHASRSAHTSSLRSENRTRGKSSGQERWLVSRRVTWDFVPVKRERKDNGFIRLCAPLPAKPDAARFPVCIGKCILVPCIGRLRHPSPALRSGPKANAQPAWKAPPEMPLWVAYPRKGSRAAEPRPLALEASMAWLPPLGNHRPLSAGRLPLSVALPPPVFLQLSFGLLRKKAFIGVPIIANCAVDRSGSVTKQFLSYNVTEDLKCCLFDWSRAKFLRVTRPLHMLQDTSAAFDTVTLSIDKY